MLHAYVCRQWFASELLTMATHPWNTCLYLYWKLHSRRACRTVTFETPTQRANKTETNKQQQQKILMKRRKLHVESKSTTNSKTISATDLMMKHRRVARHLDIRSPTVGLPIQRAGWQAGNSKFQRLLTLPQTQTQTHRQHVYLPPNARRIPQYPHVTFVFCMRLCLDFNSAII